MKKTVTHIGGMLALSLLAVPALACTNLKTSETQKAPYSHQTELHKQAVSEKDLILPMDHGPRVLQYTRRPDTTRRSTT